MGIAGVRLAVSQDPWATGQDMINSTFRLKIDMDPEERPSG